MFVLKILYLQHYTCMVKDNFWEFLCITTMCQIIWKAHCQKVFQVVILLFIGVSQHDSLPSAFDVLHMCLLSPWLVILVALKHYNSRGRHLAQSWLSNGPHMVTTHKYDHYCCHRGVSNLSPPLHMLLITLFCCRLKGHCYQTPTQLLTIQK
jgi:hypothetical protein